LFGKVGGIVDECDNGICMCREKWGGRYNKAKGS